MSIRKPVSICFFGYDELDEGGRAWAVRTGLAAHGVTVKRCQTRVDGFFAKYRDLHKKWNKIDEPIHAVYVIFMGYYLMPLAWYLARRRGVPIILDVLVSQYDTEVTDRRRVARFSVRAFFLWIVDYISCHVADALVVDTEAHREFFARTFTVAKTKIVVVPVGCRSDLFVPLPQASLPHKPFTVEFHGGFSPLQGVEWIVDAAKILQDRGESVQFELTGRGQTLHAVKQKIHEFALTNIALFGMQPLQELPRTVARGDVCLGIFGTTDKALRVIPNKVYECMSCGKAVITERSVAALEALHDGADVCMVKPGDAAALAEKILELKRDDAFRTRLGAQARATSLVRFSPQAITESLVHWLESNV